MKAKFEVFDEVKERYTAKRKGEPRQGYVILVIGKMVKVHWFGGKKSWHKQASLEKVK